MTDPDPQPRLIPDEMEECPECHGEGLIFSWRVPLPARCSLCKGSGVVSDLLARQHRLLMRSAD